MILIKVKLISLRMLLVYDQNARNARVVVKRLNFASWDTGLNWRGHVEITSPSKTAPFLILGKKRGKDGNH